MAASVLFYDSLYGLGCPLDTVSAALDLEKQRVFDGERTVY
jgi:hypothetical protein